MAKRRRSNRWASQAAQLRLVRYGPEESGLNELMRQAQGDYKMGLAQARGNAAGTIATIDEAIPGVRDIYERAGLTQARTASTFAGDAGSLAPGSPLAAAASLEQQVGVRHLNEAQSAALTGLQNQRVAAKAGKTFASNKARSDFLETVAKVLQRKQDLAAEEGAFTASTAQQLMQADLDRQQQLDIANARLTQQERNSLRSAGINPDNGKPIKGGELDPNAPRYKDKAKDPAKRKPTGADRTAQQALAKASAWIPKLDNASLRKQTGGDQRRRRQAIAEALIMGDRASGLPAIPPAALSAALDVYFYGGLSEAAIKKLRRSGIDWRLLGVPRGNRTEQKIRSGAVAGPPSPR